jgi:hypothetical protein
VVRVARLDFKWTPTRRRSQGEKDICEDVDPKDRIPVVLRTQEHIMNELSQFEE